MKSAAKFMIEEKKLIDTNILVYAYIIDNENHPEALRVLKTELLNRCAVVSIQNLAEFSRITTEKIQEKISFEQARNIVVEMTEIADVVGYDAQVVADALSLCSIHKIYFFDALIAATMEKEKISTIVTENEKDFKKIKWMKAINPFKKTK